MRFASILIATLLTIAAAYGKEQPVTLKTSTGDIQGTLSLPDSKKKIPVVLIIAGSGPTDRNGNQSKLINNSLKMVADSLNKHGIASLRFDKRGIAESAAAGRSEADLRFESYIADVKGWIDLLAKEKKYSEIIVAGHSEGSLIGLMAAVGNKDVDAFISVAGPARPADEMIKEQLMAQPEQIREMVYPMLDTLKKGDTLTNVPQMLYALFRPSAQPYMISWFKYDPRAEIRKLKVPALIVQGTTDIQVLEKDADMLAEAYPGATKKLIQSMNHVLKDCVTTDKAAQVPIYSNPDLPLNKEFVTEVVSFIKSL
jgi:pimeloyl-ACP methyl ester carboxylesterase